MTIELPAPAAIVLDLDGVLADIERRTALATPDEVAALAAELPLAVVTSCPRRLAESVLTRHGFREHIGAVVGSEDGPGKPSPAPVWLALERLDRAGQPAWMLGDNPSDVEAAVAADVVALAMAPRGIGGEAHAARLRRAGAAELIGGISGLLELLSRPRDS
ncbi:MAG: HAD-IA family hydrolase [bacterium]|nr:HAD-IA family hydrolase [bacterium]